MSTRKQLFLVILSGILSMIPGYGRNHTFYIIPPDSNSSCCPTKHSCATLDNFANNELPGLKGANFTVNLIMLGGVHSLTVPMQFVNMTQVIVSGVSGCADTQAEIQLRGQNIKLSNVLYMEVSNVSIHGMGQYALIVQKSLLSGKVIMNNVTMLAVALQIPTDSNPQLRIVSCLFIASMIEILVSQMSYYNISNSIFLCKGQQYTISVCNPPAHQLPMSNFNDGSVDPGLILYNVTVMDLKESAPITKVFTPFLCGTNRTILGPTDIYISTAGVFNLEVTNCNFHRSYGSAIIAQNCAHSQFVIRNTTFSDYTQGVLLFTGNFDDAVISLTNTNMSHNSINTMGGIIAAATLTVYPTDNFNATAHVEITHCLFSENADNVGNLQIIMLHALSRVKISNSNFTLNNGTVIGAYETEITFAGNNLFERNLAHQGGALVLKASLMNLANNTTITFANNFAIEFGGAIFVDNHLFYLQNDYSTRSVCFYQPLIREFKDIKLNFTNNLATSGGDHIYGTGIRNFCKAAKFRLTQQELDEWHSIIHYTLPGGNDSYSPISSTPMRVCLCDPDGSPMLRCNDSATIFSRLKHEVYPGEVFEVSVAVVGAEFGATVGPVYANLLQSNDPATHSVSPFGNKTYDIQYVRNKYPCTILRYTVWSTNQLEIMYLATTNLTLTIDYYGDTQEQIKNAADDSDKVIPVSLLTTPIFINITLRSCPKGFKMTKQHFCDCYPALWQYNVMCLFKDGGGYVSREGNVWIGVDTNNQSSTLSFLVNGHCPYDNCIRQSTLINLETDPDHQCAFNHSGILCGSCKPNYSIAIGSSHCLYCPNNSHLFLLIFFAAAGPLLYVFIAFFNLTITNGTINGLLFYANIVWIYQNILFPSLETLTNGPNQRVVHTLEAFIAWLNLDFGIETCFIQGLDTFWKSMLQYVFPAYIWIIASVIICLYRQFNVQNFQKNYPILANMSGNPVDVLVTFILLSYTKLVRTIKDALGFAILTNYPEVSTRVVWAQDGTVDYLIGKHIALFAIGVLALIITQVYTIYIIIMGVRPYLCECRTATIEQEEEEEENGKNCKLCQVNTMSCLVCVDMPLPLSNAHFASLDDRHRYWLGLTLLVRTVLLLTFTVLDELAPSLNLPILFTTATILLFHMVWNNTHKTKIIRFLEGLSLSNLIFLSGGIQYSELREKRSTWQSWILIVSLGIAVIQFLGIIIHHLIQCCIKKTVVKDVQQTNLAQTVLVQQHDQNDITSQDEVSESLHAQLRESIIDDDIEYNDHQPLIVHPSIGRHARHCLCCCKY